MSNPTELPDLNALSNEELIEIGQRVRGIEASDRGGYFLPITFGREVERAVLARRSQPEGEAPQADGLTRYSMWSNPVGHGMDPSPSGDWVSFDEVRDLLSAQYQGARCSTCDGTGMVHRADGEYLGECGCEDAASAPAATLSPLCGAQHAESGKEVAAKPPFPISDDEMAALRRFWECATDGEGYDVEKSMMQRLAEMGLVQRKSGAYYMATDFGLYVLDEYTIQRAAQLDGGQEGSESNG